MSSNLAISHEKDDEEEDVDGEAGATNGDERKKSETELLYDEATMPLEEVLKRYKRGETRTKRALEKANKQSSSSQQACGSAQADDDTTAAKKPLKTSDDFQKQEEIDMDEIKKNSANDSAAAAATPTADNSSNNNHEQDYDEASNLVSAASCSITLNRRFNRSYNTKGRSKRITAATKTSSQKQPREQQARARAGEETQAQQRRAQVVAHTQEVALVLVSSRR